MKKTIISTLAVILTVPAFATGISPNDTGDNMCVYNVLNTYTGPANLTAGWQANTIQLKWYNGDQQLNVQSAANRCTYDSGLTIPSTQPTKTGYTFAGWKVKAATGGLCGLTSTMMNNNPTYGRAKVNSSGDYCYSCNLTSNENCPRGSEICSESAFSSMSVGDWEIEFDYGKIKAISSCNSTSVDMNAIEQMGEQVENGTLTMEEAMALYTSYMTRPNNTFDGTENGVNCWCRFTSYIPNGGAQCSLSSPWIYGTITGSSPSECVSGCAVYCLVLASGSPEMRAVLLGSD